MTPVASWGPALLTVTVNTTVSPGVVLPLPSASTVRAKLLVTDRSETRTIGSSSIAVLLLVSGSPRPALVTVAMFVRLPLALADTVPVTV